MNKTVIEILQTLSGENNIKSSDTLLGDLGFDSLRMVTLLIELEERLEIELQESDMNPFDLSTVADVMKLADKYCKGAKG